MRFGIICMPGYVVIHKVYITVKTYHAVYLGRHLS